MSATIIASDGFSNNGVSGLVFVSRRRRKSPVYGFGWTCTYRGTPEAINAAFLSLAEDQEAETDEQGPIHALTVFTPDDPAESASGVLTNTFELHGNSLQKDVREHPKAIALAGTLSSTGQPVMNEIERCLAIERPTTSADGDLVKIGAAGSTARLLYDYMRQRKGGAAFQVSQFVFRVTTVISRRATYQIAYANLNRIYTFAQLSSETNPPSGYVISLNSIASQCAPASTPSGYSWGWLKQAPTLTMVAGNRLAVQSEWWLEEWSTFIYSVV